MSSDSALGKIGNTYLKGVTFGIGGVSGVVAGKKGGEALQDYTNPAAPAPNDSVGVANSGNSSGEIAEAQSRNRKNAGRGSAADVMAGGAGLSTQPKTSSNVLLGS